MLLSETASQKNFRINYTDGTHFDYSLENGEVTQADFDRLEDMVADLSDNQLIAEEEGTEIYVTDAAKARFIFRMTKESSQETTEGYNIFPYAPAETKTQNGITVTSDGKGNYTINGTATDRVDIYFNLINEMTIPVSVGKGGNGKLYLFNKIELSTSSVNFMKDNSQIDYWTLSPMNRTHNSYGALGGKVCNGITFYIPAGVTVSNGKVSPMFTNDGDTTHDFEPYTGGEASPSPLFPQSVEVVEGYENLYHADKSYNFISTVSTWYYIDGTRGANGENVGDKTELKAEVENGKTYIIKVGELDVNGTIHLIYGNEELIKNITKEELLNGYQFTANKDGVVLLRFYLNANTEVSISKVQLTEDTSEHPYVPHGNNYVDVKVTGKNLFNKDNISLGYVNADGTLSSDNVYKTSDFISIQPNTAYYKTNTASPRTKYYDSNKQPLNTTTYQDISIGGSAGTFTTPNNARYLRFSFPSTGSAAVDVNSIMINEGSTAAPYEPYQESIVPIALNGNFIGGKDNYLDELIVDKFGKCYLGKRFIKLLFNGQGNWSTRKIRENTQTLYEIGVTQYNLYSTSSVALGLCNKYIKSIEFMNNNTFRVMSGNTLGIRNDTIGSLADFKNDLDNKNLIVYYPLAQEDLIDLNYTIDLKTFKGVSNITNSENANMKIRYVQDINTIISEMKNAILEIGGE